MAASFTMTTNLRLVPTWTEPLDLVDVIDRTTILETPSLANGTGAGQADAYYRDVRTVAAGQTDTLTLSAVPLNVYGGSATVAFAQLRLIYVKNRSTTATLSYEIGAEAVSIAPGGIVLWYAGSNVTAPTYSASEIRLTNAGGSAADYEIMLVGVQS